MRKSLLLLSIFIAGVITPFHAFACGTVEGWVEVYFNPRHSQQDQAIYKINCGPIFELYYKASLEQHQLLSGMIADALKSEKQWNK